MKQIMRLSTAASEWEVDPEDAARLVREGSVTAFALGGTLFVKPQQFEAELLRAVKEFAPQDPKLLKLLERELAPEQT